MEKKDIVVQDIIKLSDYCYEIPRSFRSDMLVSARVFLDRSMLDDVMEDRSLQQLVNIATLPGIQKHAYAMPDIHQGYGFPIGGVAATAIDEGGVISPGGIGYDINCGVRLLTTNLLHSDIAAHLEQLATELFHAVPSGVGKGGRIVLDSKELDNVLTHGARQMLSLGYGTEQDVEHCQEGGYMSAADAQYVSPEAKKRGKDQLGTLGSGNHFLEVQKVDAIYDEQVARVFGLYKDQVVVMIHCGSRGLGHQTCTDYVRVMMNARDKWNYELPDRELVCAPFLSQEGHDYFAAQAAAANFAWANRHIIGHWVRETFHKVIGSDCSVATLYDVSHNIGTCETHGINGKKKSVVMHRKGATRSFGPGTPETPASYRSVGQPVLIPGTMGTASYVLVGTDESMGQAFGSCCHGAGRKLSRSQAKKTVRGSELRKQLADRGIIIRCDSDVGLAEEAPLAYKDVDSVVTVVSQQKLARTVARVTPLAVIKGG